MGYYWRFYENPNVLIQETYMQDESGYVVSPRPTLLGSCNMYIGDETGSNYNLEGQALGGRTVSDTNWLKVTQGGDVRTAYAYGDRMPASFSGEETNFKTATLSAWSCTQSVMLPYKTKTGHTQGIYKGSGGADAYRPGTGLAGSAPGENGYLYPTFTPNTYYVRFNANGGSGSMSNQTFTYDVAQALTTNAFTYSGKTFKGGDTNSAGTTVVYTDGQSVSNLSATQGAIVDLYAVGEDAPTPTESKFKVNVNGSWKPAKAHVNVNGTWKTAKIGNNINGVWKQITTGSGPTPPPVTYTPLCFTAAASDVTIELNKSGNPSITNTAYSLDGTTGTTFTPSETSGTNPITLSNIGDKVYFKNTYTGPNSTSNYLYFNIDNLVDCSGSIMSMCSGDNYATATEIPYDYMFIRLFGEYGVPIKTPPALPATVLKPHCYRYMFGDCGKLKTSPELPATNLAESCYRGMFYPCEELEEIGAIHATTYAVSCMQDMFCGCSKLKQIPAMLGTHFPTSCCQTMYESCEALEMYTTSGGTHTTPYRLPDSGTGTTSTDAFYWMFICDTDIEDCTPAVNTTYYTNATIIRP